MASNGQNVPKTFNLPDTNNLSLETRSFLELVFDSKYAPIVSSGVIPFELRPDYKPPEGVNDTVLRFKEKYIQDIRENADPTFGYRMLCDTAVYDQESVLNFIVDPESITKNADQAPQFDNRESPEPVYSDLSRGAVAKAEITMQYGPSVEIEGYQYHVANFAEVKITTADLEVLTGHALVDDSGHILGSPPMPDDRLLLDKGGYIPEMDRTNSVCLHKYDFVDGTQNEGLTKFNNALEASQDKIESTLSKACDDQNARMVKNEKGEGGTLIETLMARHETYSKKLGMVESTFDTYALYGKRVEHLAEDKKHQCSILIETANNARLEASRGIRAEENQGVYSKAISDLASTYKDLYDLGQYIHGVEKVTPQAINTIDALRRDNDRIEQAATHIEQNIDYPDPDDIAREWKEIRSQEIAGDTQNPAETKTETGKVSAEDEAREQTAAQTEPAGAENIDTSAQEEELVKAVSADTIFERTVRSTEDSVDDKITQVCNDVSRQHGYLTAIPTVSDDKIKHDLSMLIGESSTERGFDKIMNEAINEYNGTISKEEDKIKLVYTDEEGMFCQLQYMDGRPVEFTDDSIADGFQGFVTQDTYTHWDFDASLNFNGTLFETQADCIAAISVALAHTDDQDFSLAKYVEEFQANRMEARHNLQLESGFFRAKKDTGEDDENNDTLEKALTSDIGRSFSGPYSVINESGAVKLADWKVDEIKAECARDFGVPEGEWSEEQWSEFDVKYHEAEDKLKEIADSLVGYNQKYSDAVDKIPPRMRSQFLPGLATKTNIDSGARLFEKNGGYIGNDSVVKHAASKAEMLFCNIELLNGNALMSAAICKLYDKDLWESFTKVHSITGEDGVTKSLIKFSGIYEKAMMFAMPTLLSVGGPVALLSGAIAEIFSIDAAKFEKIFDFKWNVDHGKFDFHYNDMGFKGDNPDKKGPDVEKPDGTGEKAPEDTEKKEPGVEKQQPEGTERKEPEEKKEPDDTERDKEKELEEHKDDAVHNEEDHMMRQDEDKQQDVGKDKPEDTEKGDKAENEKPDDTEKHEPDKVGNERPEDADKKETDKDEDKKLETQDHDSADKGDSDTDSKDAGDIRQQTQDDPDRQGKDIEVNQHGIEDKGDDGKEQTERQEQETIEKQGEGQTQGANIGNIDQSQTGNADQGTEKPENDDGEEIEINNASLQNTEAKGDKSDRDISDIIISAIKDPDVSIMDAARELYENVVDNIKGVADIFSGILDTFKIAFGSTDFDIDNVMNFITEFAEFFTGTTVSEEVSTLAENVLQAYYNNDTEGLEAAKQEFHDYFNDANNMEVETVTNINGIESNELGVAIDSATGTTPQTGDVDLSGVDTGTDVASVLEDLSQKLDTGQYGANAVENLLSDQNFQNDLSNMMAEMGDDFNIDTALDFANEQLQSTLDNNNSGVTNDNAADNDITSDSANNNNNLTDAASNDAQSASDSLLNQDTSSGIVEDQTMADATDTANNAANNATIDTGTEIGSGSSGGSGELNNDTVDNAGIDSTEEAASSATEADNIVESIISLFIG